MKSFATMEDALEHVSRAIMDTVHAFKYKEIDEAEVRYRLTGFAGELSDLQGCAAKRREKEARGGYLTVTFDAEGPELAEIFAAAPALLHLLRNTEAALGMVTDGLDEMGDIIVSGHVAVLQLAGQALRYSIDRDIGPVMRLHQKIVAAHVQHCEARNALAEGVAA